MSYTIYIYIYYIYTIPTLDLGASATFETQHSVPPGLKT